MGYDIHIHAEHKQANGTWSLALGMEENRYYFLGDTKKDPDEGDRLYPAFIPKEAADVPRNSELFCILAIPVFTMRVAEGNCYKSIAPLRGLPPDMSPELRAFANLWDDEYDCMYPTWLLLSEVLNFPWSEKTILREAMVDSRVAPLFRGEGYPHSWEPRRGFPLEDWPEDIERGYAGSLADGVKVQWVETYLDVGQHFLESIEPLRALGNIENTRLVFWFDG